ncbi:MAG: type II toxin-antitoxin system HicB family antitoxin [Synergistaceae bacterium]|nr:type II toxin-antitoxin system HicB family antitoxin [Synergistaceae bacterium]
MLSAYPACFIKEDNGYSVIFPDLGGLATCGDSLDDAFAMAIDCLAGYLHSCKIEGGEIPSPSPMNEISADDVARELETEAQEAFVNMVTVDVDEYAKKHFKRSVKKTLTIPAWLNDRATAEGINFSQTLQEALRSRLGV